MSSATPKPLPQEPAGGLLSSLNGLLATLGESASTRLELLFLDLQQAFDALASVLLWALLALFAAGLGVLIGALALIFAYWNTHRVLVSLLVMAALLLLAAAATLLVLSKLRAQRRLFAATLEQIARDRDCFRGAP